MLRKPACLAFTASRLASQWPYFLAENILCRTTPRSGLQVAFQYTTGWRPRLETIFCTPTTLEEPLRRRSSAQWRRDFCLGNPSLASSFLRCTCAAANALALPPCLRSVKKAEWILPLRITRTKNPCVRCDGWSIRQMPGVAEGWLMIFLLCRFVKLFLCRRFLATNISYP